jgi:hypothetical protein
VVRLLLAHPDVEAYRTTTDGRSALCFASQSGHGAIVSLWVAHRAHGQVRLLAADAIDSLPAVLLKELPFAAAQAAALRLPLDVAAALGDTEEERAAADVLASQSASLEAANAQLAAAAVQTPQELARAREALARAPAQSPSGATARAAWEREADAALRAAMTTHATQRPGAGGPPTRRDSSARRRHHGAGRRARQARARRGEAHCRRRGHVDLAAARHAFCLLG